MRNSHITNSKSTSVFYCVLHFSVGQRLGPDRAVSSCIGYQEVTEEQDIGQGDCGNRSHGICHHCISNWTASVAFPL